MKKSIDFAEGEQTETRKAEKYKDIFIFRE